MTDGSADTAQTLVEVEKKIGDPIDVLSIHVAPDGTIACGGSRALTGYYARRDEFGRVVFDKCATTHQHLTRPNDGVPNGVCVIHLGQLIPDEALNRLGRWLINIQFEPYNDPTYDEKFRKIVGTEEGASK